MLFTSSPRPGASHAFGRGPGADNLASTSTGPGEWSSSRTRARRRTFFLMAFARRPPLPSVIQLPTLALAALPDALHCTTSRGHHLAA
jgi:hypothetical protein